MKDSQNLPAVINFTFEETTCRTMFNTETQEGYVCLSDLLKAMGSKSHPQDMLPDIREMFEDGGVIVAPIPDALGRIQDTTFISEHAAMFVISRGRTEVSKRLNRWLFGEVLPALRKTGTYTLPQPAKSTPPKPKLSPLAPEVKAAISIAKAFGFKGNQAILSANNLIRNTHGVDALAQMGQSHLITETQELYFTPTQLGERLGISGRKFNDRLIASGLAERVDGIVKPTDKGKPFAQILDTSKRHGDGTPVQQVKWAEQVSVMLPEDHSNGNGGATC